MQVGTLDLLYPGNAMHSRPFPDSVQFPELVCCQIGLPAFPKAIALPSIPIQGRHSLLKQKLKRQDGLGDGHVAGDVTF